MTAKERVEAAGAEYIDSGLAGTPPLAWAASDDINVMAKLLDDGLIEAIRKGGTIKYNGVVKHDG